MVGFEAKVGGTNDELRNTPAALGELLEGVAGGRARASIQELAALVPKTAWLETDGQTRDVPADSVAVADREGEIIKNSVEKRFA